MANEDFLAPATYLHTKVELPAPDRTGEIIAEFDHNRDKALLSFRTLTIKIGSRTIDVPKRILDFFIGPQPATIQLLVGPPSEPDSKTPDYFHVSFRYISYDYEGVGYPVERPTGSIYIKNGSLQGIARWETRPDGGPKVQFYDTNLKEVEFLK